MQDWVDILSQSTHSVQFKLKNQSWLDMDVIEKVEVDQGCVPLTINDQKRAIFSYTFENYISLSDVLQQYSFEKEEGYLFLIQLFDSLLYVNRNKPILFNTDFIFVSPNGDNIKCVVIPIQLEQWVIQKDTIQCFVKTMSETFQTHTNFEIVGFLLLLSKSDECSLSNVISGLKNLQRLYCPKRLFSIFGHKKQMFYTKEPFHSIKKESYKNHKISLEPMQYIEKTQLIGVENRKKAYLLIDDERYDLISESILVGRSLQCDVRLSNESVSLKHAKITCLQDRYYIQDLKSRNGTFLNDKHVVRRMRLKQGMSIRFGLVSGIFYES